MFGELKYIIDEDGHFMIFSPTIYHITANQASQRHTGSLCVGAGYIYLSNGIVSCWGYSESLNIKSRGNVDAKFIAESLGLKVSD